MNTIVFQSYRTTNVPPWLQACLQTTRNWAASLGFNYRFLDDRFFDYCPEQYRTKVNNHVLLLSDLARLMVARQLLQEGYDRTVWIDADMLIFAPSVFSIDTSEPFALCNELWINRRATGFVGWRRVNNAVCVFDRGNAFLDFYIAACSKIVANQSPPVDPLAVGTKFLTELHKLVPFALIAGVATLSPVLMESLSRGDPEPLRGYRKAFNQPIAAANLCGSFRGRSSQGINMTDEIYEAAVQRLLGDTGREIAFG
jgi:hypothetical protein